MRRFLFQKLQKNSCVSTSFELINLDYLVAPKGTGYKCKAPPETKQPTLTVPVTCMLREHTLGDSPSDSSIIYREAHCLWGRAVLPQAGYTLAQLVRNG